MNKFTIIAVVVFSAVTLPGQTTSPKLSDFSGMAGCWELVDGKKGSTVSEQWMRPAGNSILGMARTVRNGVTSEYEFMRIEERPDGMFFVARHSASPDETAFKLKSMTRDGAVFENPEHDFPQRVIYKAAATKLTGRIEGIQNGKSMGIDFPMSRVDCAAK
jgi:hypothetical protein